MYGCCKSVEQTSWTEYLTLDNHVFCVKIVYCKNCGSTKSTSNIQHIKNKDGNKTEH